jgi:hypothetical protein
MQTLPLFKITQLKIYGVIRNKFIWLRELWWLQVFLQNNSIFMTGFLSRAKIARKNENYFCHHTGSGARHTKLHKYFCQ